MTSIHVDVPDDLHDRAKAEAERTDRTIERFFLDALELLVDLNEFPRLVAEDVGA